MKLALISDLHANRQALTAVLEHAAARGVQQHALLGDYLGYGGDPAWVLDRVMELVEEGAVAVMGNHDSAVARGALPGMREEAREVAEWTRSQLQPYQLAFVKQLPMTVERGEMLFVHANAYDPASYEYIQGRLEAIRSMHATKARYTFCGHMHEPMLFHLSGTGKAGEFTPQAGVEIPLLTNRQWLAIPGSCGQPRDGNPAACYAIFDSEQSVLSFQRVPYDADAAAASVRAAGLPARLADRLLVGE